MAKTQILHYHRAIFDENIAKVILRLQVLVEQIMYIYSL